MVAAAKLSVAGFCPVVVSREALAADESSGNPATVGPVASALPLTNPDLTIAGRSLLEPHTPYIIPKEVQTCW